MCTYAIQAEFESIVLPIEVISTVLEKSLNIFGDKALSFEISRCDQLKQQAELMIKRIILFYTAAQTLPNSQFDELNFFANRDEPHQSIKMFGLTIIDVAGGITRFPDPILSDQEWRRRQLRIEATYRKAWAL